MTNAVPGHGSTTVTARFLGPRTAIIFVSEPITSMGSRDPSGRTSTARTRSVSMRRKSRRGFSCAPPVQRRAGYDRGLEGLILPAQFFLLLVAVQGKLNQSINQVRV